MKTTALLLTMGALLAVAGCGEAENDTASTAQQPPAPVETPPPPVDPPPVVAPPVTANPDGTSADRPDIDVPEVDIDANAVVDDTYTVEAGDTLYSIARKNNVSVDDLMRWNDIENPDMLLVGQTVKLNASGR